MSKYWNEKPLLLNQSRYTISSYLWDFQWFTDLSIEEQNLFIYMLGHNEGGIIEFKNTIRIFNMKNRTNLIPREVYENMNKYRLLLRHLEKDAFFIEDYYLFTKGSKSAKSINIDAHKGQDSKICRAIQIYGIHPYTIRGVEEVWRYDGEAKKGVFMGDDEVNYVFGEVAETKGIDTYNDNVNQVSDKNEVLDANEKEVGNH